MTAEHASNKTVLVTGANGYIASWLVKKLLASGHRVHATVRNPGDTAKVGHLLGLANGLPGKLELFKADLLQDGSFDEAMKGCEIVFHTASPFIARNIDDPEKQLIRPALEGTRNVLSSANRVDSVRKVVLTSSIAAVFGDAIDIRKTGKKTFDEHDWNETSSAEYQPYQYSKKIAEKLAWDMCAAQDRWQLVTINPGMVFGPSLGPTGSESIKLMQDFGNGTLLLGAPDLVFAIVDVRNIADAHIKAAFTESSSGRYICVSESLSYMDISKAFRKQFGWKHPFPRMNAPKPVVWAIAPLLGLQRDFVKRNVGFPLKFNNRRAAKELGINFLPARQTVIDHFDQMLEQGMV
jgi:nucleoside-diphosphate-sugar epimerase